VKRTAHYLGLLFRSRLVGFASKEEMTTSRVPVVEQFLAGRPEGPIGMDEMADAVEDELAPAASDPDVPTLTDLASRRAGGPDESPDGPPTMEVDETATPGRAL
jgi:hypothetical protein